MFTDYINRFLDLLERFVVATERRNQLIIEGRSSLDGAVKELAESRQSEKESQSDSTGSASDAPTGRAGRTRSRAGAAGSDTPEATENTGRRSRTRAGASESTQQEEETPATGRRQRSRAGSSEQQEDKKPDPVKDTPEQADIRAEVEHLCQLAGDVDDCAAAVKEYFLDKGWKTATDVPGADLQDVQDDLNEIIDKYFD